MKYIGNSREPSVVASSDVWEDRRIKKNGSGGYQVNVPKNWVEALNRPASEVLKSRVIFQVKDGKPSVRFAMNEKQEDWLVLQIGAPDQ